MSGKTDRATEELMQLAWETKMRESGMDKLDLKENELSMTRGGFLLGFGSGGEAMLNQMRDIYENDIDLFESFFEIND